MCVWQSQAPTGTSKFTGVDGCDAVARAVRLRMGRSGRNRGKQNTAPGLSLYSAGVAAFARIMAAGPPAARAAKNVMTAHISEHAARKYSPASKLPVESLIQPTMKGPK